MVRRHAATYGVRADGAVQCGAAGARLPLKNGRDPGRGGLSIILRALTK